MAGKRGVGTSGIVALSHSAPEDTFDDGLLTVTEAQVHSKVDIEFLQVADYVF